jgi:hypothetical protein
MVKKSASFVLAALRASTYRKAYASAPRLLRPRWMAFLTILRVMPSGSQLKGMCHSEGI